MAQLKDTVVSGSLRATDTIYTNKIQTSIIGAPTSSNGTTFGVGTNGQILKSNGTSVYWSSDSGVTSVRVQATSPVTSSVNTAQTGSLDTTIALANNYGDTKNPYASKTKNTVLAAPATANGVPGFRALVADDIPTISAAKASLGSVSNNANLNSTTGAKGDIIYWSAANTPAHLTNTSSTTKHFLSITSQVPSWSTVTKGDVGLGNVENTALSTWAGTNKITTVGTIGTGTWQGTTVAVNHGGTGATSFTANSVIMSGSTTTAALTTRAITDNSSNADVTSSDTNLITGRTLYYQLAKKGYLTYHQMIMQDGIFGPQVNRYVQCTTAAGIAEKTVSFNNNSGIFDYEAGLTVRVQFIYSNTAANPTLKIDDLSSVPIYKFGTTRPGTTPEDSWSAGEVVTFVYDGTGWQMSSNPIMGLTTAQENALLALIT